MRTLFFALLLFILLGISTIQPNCAYAYSCVMPDPPLDALEQATAVFEGKVSAINPNKAVMRLTDPIPVVFTVNRVWKGSVYRQQVIFIIALSDSDIQLGQEYLVYAKFGREGLTTSLCSRTTLLEQARTSDLPAFARLTPQPPIVVADPVSTPTPPQPTPSLGNSFVKILIWLVVGVVLGFILAFFRNRGDPES